MTRPLDLGIFLPNAKGGAIMATGSPPQYFPSWELNRKNALIAEGAGFDFLLSMVKWRGFGGETNHWDYSLESFTLMAACAAVTSRIQLYASVAIPTVHPGVIAKMVATIDDISQGRFGLNIVSGWNKMEYAQMGLWQGDDYFARRYEYAAEYLEVLQRLWTEDRVTHHGAFFALDDCKSYPKPSRRIPLICAGQSDRGIAFTSRHADFGFLGGQDDSLEDLGRLNARLQTSAQGFGREVGAYVLLTVIAEETDEQAQAKRDHFIATSDREAMAEWARVAGMDFSRATYKDLAVQTFMAIPYVAGSYQSVADYLDGLAENGLAGVCFIFPDYETDLQRLIDRVLPLMKHRRA
ncbi:LLM class flavin-dependent oxidoreductase [Ancylobacter pratisalsi]|uniref:LLM class flavin-dependent oxidoreductase n=1 Tax=Ancylobacter pratisalsi TaxID=1745854 RepID=A0A6P1YNE3_9HYPH|nr:LLM class flavin-dependent oxidoreductase [Ancylobacter pratisalsi]QIB33733.1 LLM class flavin-dependent oxidoreductase [Ancylobacter pratisalsi]